LAKRGKVDYQQLSEETKETGAANIRRPATPNNPFADDDENIGDEESPSKTINKMSQSVRKMKENQEVAEQV
jgi:hypothetical protein